MQMVEIQKTENILRLLEQVTSLSVVSEFLKSKGLTYSAGSWDDMREKRLLPAILDDLITNSDLINLLRSSEECGKQHVFLYHCSRDNALEFMDRGRAAANLRRKGLDHLLVEADILLEPDSPSIVDVRWETAVADISFLVKEVETREQRKFSRIEIVGEYLHKIYEYKRQRAVNVAKLHRDGLLEIRIASHKNTSKYDGDIIRFFNQIQDFLPLNRFEEISLTKAKDYFWENREDLKDLIRYTEATLCNGEGNYLSANTGSDKADLSGDSKIGKSLDLLMQEDDNAYCADANLWFRKSDHLTADIHVLLDGDVNEFALPANCSQEDYQYVLNQIRHYNR
jgi:hypothetical protein